jgi:cysteine desulfurase/selenocysteine lyase
MFDIQSIRNDFPVLSQEINNKPLVYFDNGATSQKPEIVIETLRKLYAEQNSSIHRGVHYLSSRMTERYEAARETIKEYLHAGKVEEVVFTAGTTASINLVAFSFGEAFIHSGDEILVTELEHHSNIVPWQLLAERKGARLKVIPINEKGELRLDLLDELLTEKVKILAITQVSNAIGTINPVKEIIRKAHERNIPVLLDGAQGIQHGEVNVRELDCDFYAFSGHKVYGPNGIGVLYGKEKWLEKMPPYQGGGDMIANVSFEKTTWAGLPLKFEAGTSNYPAAIALAEALRYVTSVGLGNIRAYEKELMEYLTEILGKLNGLKIYGTSPEKISTVSFLLEGIHHQDTGMILDKLGVAVRVGNHCAQPLMKSLGIEGTVRASLCFYNTKEEIDVLCEGLNKVKQMLG